MLEIMNNKGFTLIEFLIYISISVMLIGALILTTVNLLQAKGSVAVMEEVNKSTRFMTENINYAVRNSTSASWDEIKLTLEVSSPESHNPTFLYLEEEEVMLKRGDEDAVRLNSDRTRVTKFDVSVSNSSFVNIEMTVEYYIPGEGGRYSLIKDFHFAENVRGGF